MICKWIISSPTEGKSSTRGVYQLMISYVRNKNRNKIEERKRKRCGSRERRERRRGTKKKKEGQEMRGINKERWNESCR